MILYTRIQENQAIKEIV